MHTLANFPYRKQSPSPLKSLKTQNQLHNNLTKNHLNPASPYHPIFEKTILAYANQSKHNLTSCQYDISTYTCLTPNLHTTANVPYQNSLHLFSKSFKLQNQLRKNLSNAGINNCRKNHLNSTLLSLIKYEKKIRRYANHIKYLSKFGWHVPDYSNFLLFLIQTHSFLKPPLQNLASLGLKKLQTPKSTPQKSS